MLSLENYINVKNGMCGMLPPSMDGTSSHSLFQSINEGQSGGEQQVIQVVLGKVEEVGMRHKTKTTKEYCHPG